MYVCIIYSFCASHLVTVLIVYVKVSFPYIAEIKGIQKTFTSLFFWGGGGKRLNEKCKLCSSSRIINRHCNKHITNNKLYGPVQ